jgi:hypothetical protein
MRQTLQRFGMPLQTIQLVRQSAAFAAKADLG